MSHNQNPQQPKQSSRNKSEIDRFHDCCPLKLKRFPEEICELGLQRARWTKDHTGYLAFEEKQAPGCVWGIPTEDKHSYCFFKFMADSEGKQFDENEIANLLGLSKDQIKKIIETATIKLKNTEIVKELKDLHDSGGLFTEESSQNEEDIYFPDSFNAEAVSAQGQVEDTAEIMESTKKEPKSKKPK